MIIIITSLSKPLFRIMQVVERKGDRNEKMLSTKIAWLLGKGSLKDFENIRDPEISDFRSAMVDKCRVAIENRNAATWEQKVTYCYPADVESTAEVSQLVAERLSPQVRMMCRFPLCIG